MIGRFRDELGEALGPVRRRLPLVAAVAACIVAFLAGRGCASGPKGPAEMAGLADGEAAKILKDARARLVAGDTAGAGRIYRDLAAARPFDPVARMMLGIHLQDIEKDPFGALAEFSAFLRLAPDSERAELARERSRACELEISKRVNPAEAAAGRTPDEEAVRADAAKIAKLTEALSAARADAAAAREALAEAESDRDQLKRTNANLQKQIDVLKGTGSSARAPRDDLVDRFDRLSENAPVSPSGMPVRFSDFMTYEVKRGDTLWKIAQKAYNDGSRTAEIKAANPGLVGADGSVREGTILRIPR